MNALILLTLGALMPLAAQNIQLALEPAATKVRFTVDTVLHTVHGTFKLKHGELWFNAENGNAGGELVVDATSGNSDGGSRDRRMHRHVLESDKYPEIRFTPDKVIGKVNLEGDSDVKLHGVFTIHGAPHEVTINAKAHIEHGQMHAAIGFDVPYVSWGLKNPSTLFLRVNENVKIEIETSATLNPKS